MDESIYSTLNASTFLTENLVNVTVLGSKNATVHHFSVFEGCEEMVIGILFDLAVQSFNLFLGLPANILVIEILFRNRKEASTSDVFLGLLAFLDGYFGSMVPVSFINYYYWKSKGVYSALKFSYGVKDTSGPLFLSCICLDRFIAVLFPIAFSQLKANKYRIGLSVVVLGLMFAYASAKAVGGLPNFEKVFTGEILATFTWMLVCNVAILRALKKSRGAGKDDMHPMKKKAFKMVLSILGVISFNYLPLVGLFPFQDYYTPEVFRCYVQPVGYAFLNISSSIQPLLYLARLEKIPYLQESFVLKKCCKSVQTKKPPVNNDASP